MTAETLEWLARQLQTPVTRARRKPVLRQRDETPEDQYRRAAQHLQRMRADACRDSDRKSKRQSVRKEVALLWVKFAPRALDRKDYEIGEVARRSSRRRAPSCAVAGHAVAGRFIAAEQVDGGCRVLPALRQLPAGAACPGATTAVTSRPNAPGCRCSGATLLSGPVHPDGSCAPRPPQRSI